MPVLTDVLDRYGVQYRRFGENSHVSEGWVGICCTQCGDRNYKLGINLSTLKTSCWQCGGMSTAWVLHLLTGERTEAIKEELRLVDRVKTPARQGGKLVMPEGVGPLNNLHRNYLQGRGLDPYRIERLWKVQGTTQAGDPAWHLIIPVHQNREVVTWTARALNDLGRRYFTAPDRCSRVPIKDTLYGEDHVSNAVLIVEGPLDVWAVGPGAVCTYGIAFTHTQVLRLSRYPKRVVCFDSEADAQRRARALCAQLACQPGEVVNIQLSAKDAGSANPRELALLRMELE